MAHRGYIAKLEPDGSGRYIHIGHDSDPMFTGKILMSDYQDPTKTDALIALGDIHTLAPEPENIKSRFALGMAWEECQPKGFTGGTDSFFLQPYQAAPKWPHFWAMGPEWLYCWTPEGWLAAPVKYHEMPSNSGEHRASMTPEEFDHWVNHNQEPEWVEWRAAHSETQQPKPVLTVIQEYEEESARQWAIRRATVGVS